MASLRTTLSTLPPAHRESVEQQEGACAQLQQVSWVRWEGGWEPWSCSRFQGAKSAWLRAPLL